MGSISYKELNKQVTVPAGGRSVKLMETTAQLVKMKITNVNGHSKEVVANQYTQNVVLDGVTYQVTIGHSSGQYTGPTYLQIWTFDAHPHHLVIETSKQITEAFPLNGKKVIGITDKYGTYLTLPDPTSYTINNGTRGVLETDNHKQLKGAEPVHAVVTSSTGNGLAYHQPVRDVNGVYLRYFKDTHAGATSPADQWKAYGPQRPTTKQLIGVEYKHGSYATWDHSWKEIILEIETGSDAHKTTTIRDITNHKTYTATTTTWARVPINLPGSWIYFFAKPDDTGAMHFGWGAGSGTTTTSCAVVSEVTTESHTKS